MIKGIVNSLLTKFSVAALLVAGATGGLVFTGSLSGIVGPASLAADVAPGALIAGPGVTLDFPTNVLGEAVAGPMADSPVEVIEEVVIVRAATPLAVAPAAVAAVPAPGCVNDVTAALNAIVGAIPGVTTGEQGQALLAQAHALGPVATGCLDEAGRVGYAGVDAVGHLVGQVGAVAAQIQALPVVAAILAPQAGDDTTAPAGLLGGIEQVVGGTVGMVGKGLGFFGGILNLGSNPVG